MAESRRSQLGFTLIEAMIVVAVAAILVGIAYPAYTGVMRKVRRSDAHESLMKAASLQEQFYVDNKRYATKMSELGYPSDTPLSREGHYTITVSAAGTHTFTVQAVPLAGTAQAKDYDCKDWLRLDQSGTRTSSPKAASICW